MNAQDHKQDAARALLADPRRTTAAQDEIIRRDAALAALQSQLNQQNDALAKSFAEVVPPAGLSERIILRARYRQRSKWLAGIAASAMVATLTFFSLRETVTPPIAVAMLDHVVEEAGELADDGNVPVQTVTASLQRVGVKYNDLGYRVRHLAECVVDGRVGRHLVINTPQGLISFLIVPQRAGEMPARLELARADFQAVLRPAKGLAIGGFVGRQSGSAGKANMDALLQKMFDAKAGDA